MQGLGRACSSTRHAQRARSCGTAVASAPAAARPRLQCARWPLVCCSSSASSSSSSSCSSSSSSSSSSGGSSVSTAQHEPEVEQPTTNPLERLRVTSDPQARAALLTQLDGSMSRYTLSYTPSAVESFLAAELAVDSHNLMLFACQHPQLLTFDLDQQVRPAVRSLKGAGLESSDAWFVLAKRLGLLAGDPIALQRWLDLLGAQGLSSRDMTTFLVRAPPELFGASATQAQALRVLAWLKRDLGVKPEHLFQRVVCAAPGVLLQDVESQLQPLLDFLLQLGLEAQHAARMACVYPELLLASVAGGLQPLVDYLTGLGCSSAHVARLLLEVPQALRSAPADVFGSRVAALQALGIEGEALRGLVGGGCGFLIAQGAPREQLAFLREEAGFSSDQVRSLVTACPAILAEKPLELQRKCDFLQQELNMELPDLLAHPHFLGASLMQVIGPRHAFAIAKGSEARLRSPGGACASSRVRDAGGAWGWDLTQLVAGPDVDFVDALGGSVNEYEGFRTAFEEEYTNKLSAAAAKEFQDELKRLGIYEGA